MKNTIYIIIAVLSMMVLTGCAPSQSQISKGSLYPKIYSKHPKSILVLPAKNTTTSVDATDHFRYTISKPLSEKGYYVFPVHLVDSFFKSENLVDAELIRSIPVSKLKEIFNPDAILYVDINAWDTNYAVVSSSVDVGLSFSLLDANTGEEIWQNNAYAYSYSGLDGNNGLIGLVVSAIQVAINTATDYTKLSHVANKAGVYGLASGQYHPKFLKDNEEKLILYDIATLEEERLYVNDYFIKGNGKDEKVALTIRNHAKGYHAFPVHNLNMFNHNGYSNYYISEEVNNKRYLKNRFFKYENNRPYLLSKDKKVFVFTEVDGTIPYSEEDGKYYFNIEKIVELSKDKT
ncbi:MAG: hypothetical protein GY932_11535 [Arcobacter sp.]|nr:hypothetical protein [Arcobacter sp.]